MASPRLRSLHEVFQNDYEKLKNKSGRAPTPSQAIADRVKIRPTLFIVAAALLGTSSAALGALSNVIRWLVSTMRAEMAVLNDSSSMSSDTCVSAAVGTALVLTQKQKSEQRANLVHGQARMRSSKT